MKFKIEYTLILLTYLIVLIQILGTESIKTNIFEFTIIDYTCYYLYYIMLILFLISHYKTINTNPGFFNSFNHIDTLNFYIDSHKESLKRAEQINLINEKFFYNDIEEAINEKENREYLSDDSDASKDSFKYPLVNKLDKEFFVSLSEKHQIKLEIKKTCKFCHVIRIPFSAHCRRCRSCVIDLDHHCPWVSNCIGLFNYKYFILMVFYSLLLNLLQLFFIVKTLLYNIDFFFKNSINESFIYVLVYCLINSLTSMLSAGFMIKLIFDIYSSFVSGISRKDLY